MHVPASPDAVTTPLLGRVSSQASRSRAATARSTSWTPATVPRHTVASPSRTVVCPTASSNVGGCVGLVSLDQAAAIAKGVAITSRSGRRQISAIETSTTLTVIMRSSAAVGSHGDAGAGSGIAQASPTIGSKGLGAGTDPRTASTTVRPVISLIHISGFTVMRCASTGSATALTSSGVTKSRPAMIAYAREANSNPKAPARRGSHQDMGVGACGPGELHAVSPDALVDRRPLDGGLHGEHRRCVGHLAQCLIFLLPVHAAFEHVPLLVRRRIAEGGAHHEAVELRLGQRVGAFVLDRVGGGEHVERPLEHEGLTLDGDLVFLHRFEEGCLCPRRRAVDLVGEQQPGEQRALSEREVAAALVVHERSGEIGGEEVGGELGASEVEAEGLRERPSSKGLPEAGKVLEQHIAARQDRGKDERECLALSDHGDLDFVEYLAGQSGHVVEFEWFHGSFRGHSRSMWVRMRSSSRAPGSAVLAAGSPMNAASSGPMTASAAAGSTLRSI